MIKNKYLGMKKRGLWVSVIVLTGILTVIGLSIFLSDRTSNGTEKISSRKKEYTPEELWQQRYAAKRSSRISGTYHSDKPDKYFELHRRIRTKPGENLPGYPHNYRLVEYNKLKNRPRTFAARTGEIQFVERGPYNVPGRTRAVAIDPRDTSSSTWFAGSVNGGIWKTTDKGQTWTLITTDLPNISISDLKFAPSDPNILYAGTGEGGPAGAHTLFQGNGLIKSVDGGETWHVLESTANNPEFQIVNKIDIHPTDPDIVICANSNSSSFNSEFNSGIYMTTDGGLTWEKKYSPSRWAQQVLFNPQNPDIILATINGTGIVRSTDGGETWNLASGMVLNGEVLERIEMDISKTDPNYVYAGVAASATSDQANDPVINSDLYMSTDGGANWSLLVSGDKTGNYDFLGGQGWFDNVVKVHPWNPEIVYMGGVNLFKAEVIEGEEEGEPGFMGALELGTREFMDFVTFVNANAYGGKLSLGDIDDSLFVSIELRFGPGQAQMAHRFETPSDGGTAGDGGAGIPDNEYVYMDYVQVPFEVWDIDNSRQLAVSFRDQAKNGVWDLIHQKTEGPYDEQSREYFFVHTFDYDPDGPNPEVTKDGGHVEMNMYFMWPYLVSGATWNPDSLPDSKLVLNWGRIKIRKRSTTVISDGYDQYGGPNEMDFDQGSDVQEGLHVDHHNLQFIKKDDADSSFFIVVGNDGGLYYSNTDSKPGENDGDWTYAGDGYNTTQFYGADKKPGASEYIGGTQDNGSWRSPAGEEASATTRYVKQLAGDGFEAVWNYYDPDKIIGSIYNNQFLRTENGGETWRQAVGGLTDYGVDEDGIELAPFVSRLGNSKSNPDVLFAVGKQGVWKSDDFGEVWELTPIEEEWILTRASDEAFAVSSTMDVEVSLANPHIVWAGVGMYEGSEEDDLAPYALHVSVDGGRAFRKTTNYTAEELGEITDLASHPFEDSTAYALFSFAKTPKILRTKDLGKTWEDITGFEGNDVSTNGFPDVGVYCLLPLPHQPSTIWVGTEIGIVVSYDDGTSWQLLDSNLPPVAVWQLKWVDDQVVLATHGRGIWSATFTEFPEIVMIPIIESVITSLDGELGINAEMRSEFDSTIVMIDSMEIGQIGETPVGDISIYIENFTEEKEIIIQLKSFKDGNIYLSDIAEYNFYIPNDIMDSYGTDFDNDSIKDDFIGNGFSIKSELFFTNPAIHSEHNYDEQTEYIYTLKTPVRIAGSNATFVYQDIAILEPGEDNVKWPNRDFFDYVVIEGTVDGSNWLSIADGYDARYDEDWLDAYEGNGKGREAMYVKHTVDLLNTFEPGDVVIFRFRLYSDPFEVGWGWAIDNLYIQETPVGLYDRIKDNRLSVAAYPNPFESRTTLQYSLPVDGYAVIQIIDIDGKLIDEINLGFKSAGEYEFEWDGNGLRKGLYLIKVNSAVGAKVAKVLKR